MKELEQTFSKSISELYRSLDSQKNSLRDSIVQYVNTSREIGIVLQTWCNHQQITFEFFRKHDLPFDFEAAKKFVRVAKALPNPAKTVQDAVEAEQLALQAGGVLLIESSNQPETQRSKTSLFLLFAAPLASSKARFEKWVIAEPIEKWDNERRASVKEELRWAHDLYEKL